MSLNSGENSSKERTPNNITRSFLACESAQIVSEIPKSVHGIVDTFTGFNADKTQRRYNEFSKRRTPRVGTLFISSNKSDTEARFLSLGASCKPAAVPCTRIPDADQYSDNCGLEKYNRYMKAHADVQTNRIFSDIDRKIVGQEHAVESEVVVRVDSEKKVTCHSLPIFGQALFSSNIVGSSTLGNGNSHPNSFTNTSKEVLISKCNDVAVGSAYFENAEMCLISRGEDSVDEKPRESSSELESNASEPDLQELPRIPSPSSASSVASNSVRPLEWDSSADVGYYQAYPISNTDSASKMNTIEGMALVKGLALPFTRSDPECNIEPSSQSTKLGVLSNGVTKRTVMVEQTAGPIAESTLLNSNTVSSGNLPIGNGIEDLSAITEPKFCNVNSDHLSLIVNKNSLNDVAGYRVFSELDHKNEQVVKNVEIVDDKNTNQVCSRMGVSSLQVLKTNDEDAKFHTHFSYPDNKLRSYAGLEAPKMKKLCSSMEHLNINSEFNEKGIPYTLPRSLSHNSVINSVNVSDINSLPKNLILRSLCPTQSASSSSVSTIVQKRKDSPKSISKLVQTSYIQQSVGTQASGFESIGNGVTVQDCSSGKPELLDNASDVNFRKSSYFSSLKCKRSVGCCTYENVGSIHSHDGLPCLGAHRKPTALSYNSDYSPSEDRSCNKVIVKDNALFDSNYVLTSQFHKAVTDSNTLESVQSSARSGQNMWAERRESMGVEDRVNSFEYLPGHVFESATRKGNDSHGTGTSSVSLNPNESSRNEFSDDSEKLWDSSASSTLLRDIERGVNLMTDFVKNSDVSNNHLKQKLLKKVVEKLLRTKYSADKSSLENLFKDSSWIPPHLYNAAKVCNGRETRRSHNKESILNDVASSEKTSERTSSECFEAKDAYVKECKSTRETAEKCIGTDQLSLLKKEAMCETSHLSIQPMSTDVNESVDSSSGANPKSSIDESSVNKKNIKSDTVCSARNNIKESFNHKDITNSSSNANSTGRSGSDDWRIPVSKAEKLFEEKRKKQGKMLIDGKNKKTSAILLQYLNIERKNQLFWIKSEIEHLSNLKRLLEKQEELKKSLTRMKKSKSRSVLTTSNNKQKLPTETSNSSEWDSNHVENSKNSYKSHNSMNKKNYQISEDTSDWSSHHYFPFARNDKIRCSTNLKTKKLNSIPHELKKKNNKISHAGNERHIDTIKKKPLAEKVRKSITTSMEDEDDNISDQPVKKTVGTETIDSVGVQTSKSVQQLPVIKPLWHKKMLKKENVCQCKKNGICKYCKDNKSKGENVKKSLAYYITFDNTPQDTKKCEDETSKERDNDLPENKSKVYDTNLDSSATNDNNVGSDCQMSNQKENYEPNCELKVKQQRLTLQDYLLKNRADYVSRAEYRRRCVAELAYLRELRDKSKRHLLTMAPESSDYSQSSTPRDLPPPPLAVKRVFSQRTMRRQTERKYRQLAEVKNRQLDMKRKESYRTNRLMAEVFTKKLQKKTLKGEVNLSNSVSVISSF